MRDSLAALRAAVCREEPKMSQVRSEDSFFGSSQQTVRRPKAGHHRIALPLRLCVSAA
jgi:hypothetical protein